MTNISSVPAIYDLLYWWHRESYDQVTNFAVSHVRMYFNILFVYALLNDI